MGRLDRDVTCVTIRYSTVVNKAKAISAKLLELNFKNKLEETGKTKWNRKKQEKREKQLEKNTKNRKKLDDTEWNRKKQEKK